MTKPYNSAMALLGAGGSSEKRLTERNKKGVRRGEKSPSLMPFWARKLLPGIKAFAMKIGEEKIQCL